MTQADGKEATAWGNSTEATGEKSTAWGASTHATHAQATAFGQGTTANTIGSTAWGYSTLSGSGIVNGAAVSGDYTTAWGIRSQALGTGATAWGGYNSAEEHPGGTATGLGATAFGSGTWAEGTLSTAWGSGTSASGENSTAWGYMTQATAAQATAWGANTAASAAHATAWGSSTAASGEGATAWGSSTTASGTASTAFGYVGTKESGYDAPSIKAAEIGTTAYGYATLGGAISAEGGGATAFGSATMGGKIAAGVGGGPNDKEGATAFGRAYGTKGQILATGTGATAFGAASDGVIKAEEWGATAFGRTYNNGIISASGKGAAAFGYAEKEGSISAGAEGATAFGYASGKDSRITASGRASTAFGISSQAMAENSLAALGGIVETGANNSAAVGKGAKVTVPDTVALGSGSAASRTAGDADAYLKGSSTGAAWVSTHNAIAVGDDGNVTRQITGVAAGAKDTDAVNVAQLKAAAATAGSGITVSGIEISVNAGDDFTVDSDKKLQLKKDGKVAANDQGVVTGGTVYQALQGKADKATTLAGYSIADAYTKEETASAISSAVKNKADKATTLAGYGITDGVTKSEFKAVTGDVSGLEMRVSANESAIKQNTRDIGDHSKVLARLDTKLNSDKVSIGKGSSATGKRSIAIGYGNKVTGDYSGAFGDPNSVSGSGSYAVGNDNTVGGNNTFVFGNGVTANVDDAVVLGNKSQAVAGAVSVGAPGKERRITNVANGTVAKDSTDAVNGGQLWDLEQKINTGGAGLQELDRKLTRDIREVGSRAAALAGLHPLPYDEDAPTTFNVAVGNYRGDTSVAVGMAHHFNRDTLFSLSGTIGPRPMFNAGMALRLGRYDEQVVETRKRRRKETAEKNRLLGELSAQNAQLDEMKRDRQDLKAQLAQMKRERDRDRAELEELRRRMEMLEKRLSQPAFSALRRGKK